MQFIKLYLLGAAFLLTLIIINILAGQLGLPNWYQFMAEPSIAEGLDYVWLFVAYPLLLGLVALYLAKKLFDLNR